MLSSLWPAYLSFVFVHEIQIIMHCHCDHLRVTSDEQQFTEDVARSRCSQYIDQAIPRLCMTD